MCSLCLAIIISYVIYLLYVVYLLYVAYLLHVVYLLYAVHLLYVEYRASLPGARVAEALRVWLLACVTSPSVTAIHRANESNISDIQHTSYVVKMGGFHPSVTHFRASSHSISRFATFYILSLFTLDSQCLFSPRVSNVWIHISPGFVLRSGRVQAFL